MSDIFISYAEEDREKVRRIAECLEAQGWSIFWDRVIPTGKRWRDILETELEGCRCVVVVWSKASIKSHWVQEEAEIARERDILVPVLIEGILPPLGFRGLQAADLTRWNGLATEPVFLRFIADIKSTLSPSVLTENTSPAVVTPPSSLKPSVAVLYFDNMSGKREDDYFVAGMTEDIITDLCSIEGISVLSRNDVLPLRGKKINIKGIGKKLSVDYILEGSVRREGSRLRVTAQLVNAEDGYHIWADRFDEELKNVFDIQAEVARKIAESLRVRLSPTELYQMEKRPTSSIKAYDYYLKGRDYYSRLTKKDLEHAIEMYKKALEIDPDYALAYSGLTDTYVYQYEAYFERSIRILEEAEQASLKALSIDPGLPEAHRSLGRVYMFKKMQEKAIEELKKAVNLRPNFYEACRALGWIYEELRNYNEAVKWAQKAIEIRSTDKESLLLLGISYYDQQLYNLALENFHKAIEVAPDFGTAFYYIGCTFLKMGKLDNAVELFRKCIDAGCDPNVYLDLGWIYLLKKDYHNSLKAYRKSISLGYFSFVCYYFMGVVYRQIEEYKKAEDCFKKAIKLCSKQMETDPKNPYIHSTLSLAYLSLGDEDKGKVEMDISFGLAPDNGAILCDIARFYALKMNEWKLLEFLKQALKLPFGPSKFEIKSDPHFKNLLGNPSLIDLLDS